MAGRYGGTGAAPSFFRGDPRVDHARGINASGAHAGGDIRRGNFNHHDLANDDPAGDGHASDHSHRDTSFRGAFAGDDRHNNHRRILLRRNLF